MSRLVLIILSLLLQSSVLSASTSDEKMQSDCPTKFCQCEAKEGEELHVICRDHGLETSLRNLPKGTTHLELCFNQLHTVTHDTFQDLDTPNLLYLDISYSNIAFIDEDAFQHTTLETSLRSLNLSHNHLTHTQSLISVFNRFKSLEFVDMRNNTGAHCLDMFNYFDQIGSNLIIICDDESYASELTKNSFDYSRIKDEFKTGFIMGVIDAVLYVVICLSIPIVCLGSILYGYNKVNINRSVHEHKTHLLPQHSANMEKSKLSEQPVGIPLPRRWIRAYQENRLKRKMAAEFAMKLKAQREDSEYLA